MGFVSHLAEDDHFREFVEDMIQEIQAASPLILRLNKRAVTAHMGLAFPAAVTEVSRLFLDELMSTEDTREGIQSFEEKRKPEWKNR
jgi:cyclohexa-1,5-dienecarbonyl-CoA hydratase